jgi:seryl-tRNA(Sec) selenium transferase
MLGLAPEALEARALHLAEGLAARVPGLVARVARGEGQVGGGALPQQKLSGWVAELEQEGRSARELERRARAAEPPVIGTIRAGHFRLDPRTLVVGELEEAIEALARAFARD